MDYILLASVTDEPKCQSCGKNKALKPHTCPFEEEINHDDKTMCNCCTDCQEVCANEV